MRKEQVFYSMIAVPSVVSQKWRGWRQTN